MGVDMLFDIPRGMESLYLETEKEGSKYKIVNGRVCARAAGVWYTNLEHGRRHEPLKLMSMSDNLRFSKHKEIRNGGYQRYENYDAIDVPYADAIPDDYSGTMGVPDTFLGSYCPDQFEIIGLGSGYLGQSIGVGGIPKEHKQLMRGHSAAGDLYMLVDGIPKVPYSRILIRKKL